MAISTQDIDVALVQSMGGDDSIVAAAKVSTQGVRSLDMFGGVEHCEGLIRYLMKNRHGTPFEHGSMTFFVRAPIFVFREFHRHRIGWSYNEESARYKQLEAAFYIPSRDRPGLMQEEGGRPGQYVYQDADSAEWEWLEEDLWNGYEAAYRRYENRLARGYAKEVARMGLPVGIFSSMYATCNPRSLMAFLSLRTKRDEFREHSLTDEPDGSPHNGGAKFPSKPQHEINVVADAMERYLADLFPITYDAYCANGRVAP